MQNREEKENIGDKINNFVQKNRKAVTIVFGLFIAAIIGFIVFIIVKENLDKKSIEEMEELVSRYEELFPQEQMFDMEIENDYFSLETDSLLADIEEFAQRKKGFAGSKAWSMAGHIYSGREDWHNSLDSWANSARLGNKTYLGPIALFNAAVAAEELNEYELAIDYLEKSISHKFEFPAAPRAQFNIGRLYENLGKIPEAIEAYRLVIANWPDILVWQYFSRNRIINLEAK